MKPVFSPSSLKILGIDEAGRGAWAWPVVAGACAFLVPERTISDLIAALDDSKRLSERRREEVFGMIQRASNQREIVYGVGMSESSVIDSVGIREANRLAMQGAMKQVFAQISLDDFKKIRIDGRDNYRFEDVPSEKLEYIVRGDGFVKEIQAASIIAKVTRDRIMIDLSRAVPAYGFARHKWYGTSAHRSALEEHGPTVSHRASYAPVKKLILRGESV